MSLIETCTSAAALILYKDQVVHARENRQVSKARRMSKTSVETLTLKKINVDQN